MGATSNNTIPSRLNRSVTDDSGIRSVNVLIIDDDPIERELYRHFLKKNNTTEYRLTHASTGAEGLSLLDINNTDCVVLDYHLPDRVGSELFAAIREMTRSRIPVILLTGVGNETIATEVLKAGAADYIQKKHVSKTSLQRAINNAVDKFQLRWAVEENAKKIKTQNTNLHRRNEEIQRFYQTVSHELKTPLTSIQEAASLLADEVLGPINEEQREFVTMIHESCLQMTREVNDLIDITRLETGKYSIDAELCRLSDVAKSVVGSMTIMAENKRIKINLDVDDGLPGVLADKNRCNQVLTNLLSNAIKFTQDGGVIDIVAHCPEETENMVNMTVIDNGRGIEKERIEMIFDRLYQTETHKSLGYDASNSGGLGLGLSIAKQLVELQGGAIKASSKLGVGSKFVFSLPRYSEYAV